MNQARQRKTKNPCPGCGLHRDLCICEFIPKLQLKTRVSLIIHRKELKRTTNTGTLAIKSLLNSQMRIRGGLDGKPLDLSDLLSPNYCSILFYPSDEAIELTKDFVQKCSNPIQLIVPDGNWRQASKVHIRHPELKDLPCVKITAPNLAAHHLRAEHTKEGMSTLQAIALALGIIEGPEVEKALMTLYQAKLQNTLKGRGMLNL